MRPLASARIWETRGGCPGPAPGRAARPGVRLLASRSTCQGLQVVIVVGEHQRELGAGGDRELGEHFAEVVLDGARTDEELGSNLRVRVAVSCKPRDLRFLRGELPAG